MPRLRITLLALAALTLISVAGPAFAGPAPSKAEGATRAADLATVRAVTSAEPVAAALAAQGLDAGQVEQRLARLSDEDLHQLASNLDQIHAATGLTKEQWIWITVGAVGALVILGTV